jgi:uncharacterized protein (DUF2147 family)
MNRFVTLFAAAGLALAAQAGAARPADPIEGRWINGQMTINIAPCGQALCGTIIRASAKQQAKARRGSGTNLLGATLIRDIKRTKPGNYRARVFVADKNFYANGTVKMTSHNRLAVRGCVLGLVCKGADWDRVS